MRASRKKSKYNKEVYQSLALITQFGINMIVPIVLCTFLGIFLDKKLGTSFIVIVLFFLGAMAGARNVYISAKGIYDKDRFESKNDDSRSDKEKSNT